MPHRISTWLLIGMFAATVPLANFMIMNVGSCIPDGPCLIPVGFGLHAPSGVLVIGLALVLRDLIHERGGAKLSVWAILVGALLTLLFAPASLVVASVAAFVLSELADLAVYSPLRRRNLGAAVVASGLVGAVVDSAVFLWLAFGSMDFIAGQVLGKFWISAAAVAALHLRARVRA